MSLPTAVLHYSDGPDYDAALEECPSGYQWRYAVDAYDAVAGPDSYPTLAEALADLERESGAERIEVIQ